MSTLIKKILFIFLFFTSCAVKPTLSPLDKFKKAMLHYDKEEYADAASLFRELTIPLIGKNEEIDTRFYLAKCYYNRNDYTRAAYEFGVFFDLFPNSDRAEEALYLEYVSLYRQSPESNLDQTVTYKALEALKFYIDEYPMGKYLDIAREYRTELQQKIEKKDFDNLMVFYNMDYYKAAEVCCNNFAKDHPSSVMLPDVLYIKILSFSKLLHQNNSNKSHEEFIVDFMSSCGAFLSNYPNNIHTEDVRAIYEQYFNIAVK